METNGTKYNIDKLVVLHQEIGEYISNLEREGCVSDVKKFLRVYGANRMVVGILPQVTLNNGYHDKVDLNEITIKQKEFAKRLKEFAAKGNIAVPTLEEMTKEEIRTIDLSSTFS